MNHLKLLSTFTLLLMLAGCGGTKLLKEPQPLVVSHGGKSIPVEFRIYNAYSEQAGTDTTRIALGRWITSDIWVSVSSSISQERDVEAELDYKINDQFSLSTDYDADTESAVGNIGLDLKFRLEF